MCLLEKISKNEKRSKFDENSYGSDGCGGHPGLRMVHTRPNLRLEYNLMLRRHLPRPKSQIKVLLVLDKYVFLHCLLDRDVLEMDRHRFRQILHIVLDHLRLYHRFRKFDLVITYNKYYLSISIGVVFDVFFYI